MIEKESGLRSFGNINLCPSWSRSLEDLHRIKRISDPFLSWLWFSLWEHIPQSKAQTYLSSAIFGGTTTIEPLGIFADPSRQNSHEVQDFSYFADALGCCVHLQRGTETVFGLGACLY